MTTFTKRAFLVATTFLSAGCFNAVDEVPGEDAGTPVLPALPRTCGTPGEPIKYYPWDPQFDGCVIFAGNLRVTVNPPHTDLPPPGGVREVDGALEVMFNESLQNLRGFETLVRVGDLVINENRGVLSLTSLSSLRSVRFLQLFSNYKMQSLEGLSGIETLEGLVIEQNAELRSLSGLSGLKHVRGDVIIRANDALPTSEITAFRARVKVDGNFVTRF